MPTGGFMTHVTCRLTAKNRDQLRYPTLRNRVWATFTFFESDSVAEWLACWTQTQKGPGSNRSRYAVG